jgi:hypothetical protein
MGAKADHSEHSTYREHTIEHLFIGEVLRHFWRIGEPNVEVLRCEFDRGGYDLVISRRSVSRFVQFKTALAKGKSNKVTISVNLAEKPNGCVVLILLDDALNMVGFKWYGAKLGMPFPDIRDLPIAKHTKGDSKGKKSERPDHRVIRHTAFETCLNLDEVVQKLFV